MNDQFSYINRTYNCTYIHRRNKDRNESGYRETVSSLEKKDEYC